MKSLVKSLLGLALVLGWWTLRGPGASDTETSDRIPSVVWDGGAGAMTIRTETTCPAQLRVSFSDHAEDLESPRRLQSWENVPAGTHSWTIDVPGEVGGYVELSAESPKPGDQLHWTIQLGGATIDEQTETLEQALEPGHGFFLQSYFEDYAAGEFGEG